MRRYGLVTIVAAAAAIAGPYACADRSVSTTSGASATTEGTTTGGGNGSGSFSKAAMLEHLGQEVILATYAQFVKDAEALEAAAETHAGSQTTESRDALVAAFSDAMGTWQQAELMQLGPAGVMGSVAGGEDLRDTIYSWPLVNACRVDQELVEGSYADPDTFSSEDINVKGLDAISYLIFHTGQDNACAPQNNINQSGSWDTIVGELEQRRADYAHTAAILTRRRAEQLRDAWKPDGSDFLGSYVSAGSGSAVYASQRDALNATSDAMFYIEKEGKDMKLAVPLGLTDCTSDTCPEALELRRSGLSKEALAANVAGFRLLFTGGPYPDDLGFDDWLADLGAADVATAILESLDAADAALEAIEEDELDAALASDPESVQAVHDALAGVTTELKTRFVSILDLELPKTVEGDND